MLESDGVFYGNLWDDIEQDTYYGRLKFPFEYVHKSGKTGEVRMHWADMVYVEVDGKQQVWDIYVFADQWRPKRSKRPDCDRMPRDLGEWSEIVRELDGNYCQLCGIVGPLRLHAHHIRPKERYVESQLEIENGVTLCQHCHKNRVHAFPHLYPELIRL